MRITITLKFNICHRTLDETYWKMKLSVNSRELPFEVSGDGLKSGTLNTGFGNTSPSQPSMFAPLGDHRMCVPAEPLLWPRAGVHVPTSLALLRGLRRRPALLWLPHDSPAGQQSSCTPSAAREFQEADVLWVRITPQPALHTAPGIPKGHGKE